MYKKLDITSALLSAYHPQMDGQMERVNQDLETYIRMFCTHQQDDWAKWLHMAEFAYNNKEHSTIKTSPFKANNLMEPRWLMEMRTENMTHPAAEEQLKEMKLVEKELQACLDMAAKRMKEAYDKGELPLMQIGDMAYLDARNLKEKIQEKDKPTRAMTKKLRKKRIGVIKLPFLSFFSLFFLPFGYNTPLLCPHMTCQKSCVRLCQALSSLNLSGPSSLTPTHNRPHNCQALSGSFQPHSRPFALLCHSPSRSMSLSFAISLSHSVA